MFRLAPVAALVLLAGACTQPEERPVTLEDDAASALAQGAHQLATALEADDPCAAMAEADAVTAQARDGVPSGTVPADVANEVEAVAAELTHDLVCESADDGEDGEGPDGPSEPDGDPESNLEPGPDSDAGSDDPAPEAEVPSLPDDGRAPGQDPPSQALGAGGDPGNEAAISDAPGGGG